MTPLEQFSTATVLDEADISFVEKLYDKYSKLMIIQARKVLQDEKDIEDAVQQSWVKILRYLPKIKRLNCNSLPFYIAIIVKNCAIDLIRKEKAQRSTVFSDFHESFEDSILDEDTFCEFEDLADLTEAICFALKSLSEKEQFLIHSKYISGWRDSEIASFLCVKKNNVRTIIYRIKKKIWKELNRVWNEKK